MSLPNNSENKGNRNNKALNLLIIGNGFDLAHGLPTRYIDFLYFMALVVKQVPRSTYYPYKNFSYYDYNSDNIQKCMEKYESNFPKKVEFLNKVLYFSKANTNFMKSLIKYIDGNDWLRYFFFIYGISSENRENWIDLETEIYKILLLIDNNFKITNLQNGFIYSTYTPRFSFGNENIPSHKIIDYTNFIYKSNITEQFVINAVNKPTSESKLYLKKELFNYLYSQLMDFSQLLAKYLSAIENLYESVRATVAVRNNNNVNDFHFLKSVFKLENINFLLSFNYTKTFSKLYYESESTPFSYDFINGRIRTDLLDKNNIILGIDTSILKDITTFIDNNCYRFFKYIQRVELNFNQKWPIWIEDAPVISGREEIHTMIIGHSLDITDKHILSNVITKSNKVDIYYWNENDRISKIKNLLKLLGEDLFQSAVNNPAYKPYIRLIDQNEIMIKPKENHKE